MQPDLNDKSKTKRDWLVCKLNGHYQYAALPASYHDSCSARIQHIHSLVPQPFSSFVFVTTWASEEAMFVKLEAQRDTGATCGPVIDQAPAPLQVGDGLLIDSDLVGRQMKSVRNA